jgi:hypothetical protein
MVGHLFHRSQHVELAMPPKGPPLAEHAKGAIGVGVFLSDDLAALGFGDSAGTVARETPRVRWSARKLPSQLRYALIVDGGQNTAWPHRVLHEDPGCVLVPESYVPRPGPDETPFLSFRRAATNLLLRELQAV